MCKMNYDNNKKQLTCNHQLCLLTACSKSVLETDGSKRKQVDLLEAVVRPPEPWPILKFYFERFVHQ